MRYAVIMAGGVGSRFWPASTPEMPKQFLSFFSSQSLLQQTVERIKPIIPTDRIFIVTNANYAAIIKEQLPSLPIENILCEPQAKNTAPCVLLATKKIALIDPDASVAVLPADHYISQPDVYLDVLNAAFEHAEQKGMLTTIGIQPHRVEMGYGYIKYQKNNLASTGNELTTSVYKVDAFTEKPNYDKAKQFIAEGNYLWNSGMFIWSNKVIQKAFEDYAPAMFSVAASTLNKSEDFVTGATGITQFFAQVESISIDYAIMEKAESVSVLPGVFGWNDVGSWQAVYELELEKDAAANATNVPLDAIDAKGNLVRLHNRGKKVALLGVEGLAIIETEDTLMIAKLERSQDVKQFGHS
jgi:mannose-1-phosphate guanylyltransferase